jgi:hypothetical protein
MKYVGTTVSHTQIQWRSANLDKKLFACQTNRAEYHSVPSLQPSQDRENGGKTTAFKRLLDLGLEIYIDWTDHEDTDDSYVGIIFFTDGASRLVTPTLYQLWEMKRKTLLRSSITWSTFESATVYCEDCRLQQ